MSEENLAKSNVVDVSFKKRNMKRPAFRSRQRKSSHHSDGSSDEDANQSSTIIRTEPLHKRSNPNYHSTKRMSSQKEDRTKINADSTESGLSGDDDRLNVGVSYKSKRCAMPEGPQDQGAASINEIDNCEKNTKKKLQSIQQEIQRKETGSNSNSGFLRRGPMRAPANLRATVRWDYQPDVCKDYKETGYCGFGDSCKFLHDRSDYKAGWQLEHDYIAEHNGECESDGDDNKYEIHSDDESLPFKCFICRESFINPVVTKCKHYFCEKCALNHYKKSQRCFICSQQTSGIFNPAKVLIARLKNTIGENDEINQHHHHQVDNNSDSDIDE